MSRIADKAFQERMDEKFRSRWKSIAQVKERLLRNCDSALRKRDLLSDHFDTRDHWLNYTLVLVGAVALGVEFWMGDNLAMAGVMAVVAVATAGLLARHLIWRTGVKRQLDGEVQYLIDGGGYNTLAGDITAFKTVIPIDELVRVVVGATDPSPEKKLYNVLDSHLKLIADCKLSTVKAERLNLAMLASLIRSVDIQLHNEWETDRNLKLIDGK